MRPQPPSRLSPCCRYTKRAPAGRVAPNSAWLEQAALEQGEAAGGWISFERFMEMALYEPGLGYYSAGATKLGGAGDFVTAAEISPLFSRCLANQCVQVLESVTGGHNLELGATRAQ